MADQNIHSDPSIMMGKPVIAGTRITVDLILETLRVGETVDQILAAHPRLTREAVAAALAVCGTEVPAGVGVAGMSRPRFRAYPVKKPRIESGAALLAFLLVLLVGASYALLGDAKSLAQRAKLEESSKTSEALAEAKAALIGRAAADKNRPGSLPCPDVDNDGDPDIFVGSDCPSYNGRLPWRTLGVPDLGEAGPTPRLWYALSNSLRDNLSAQPINSQSIGTLTVSGTQSANEVMAIVFAPGAALEGQIRSSDNQNDIADYLDGENANDDVNYATRLSTDTFNDQLLLITRNDLLRAAEKRVVREVTNVLDRYFLKHATYPWASPFKDPTTSDFKSETGTTRGYLPSSMASPYDWGAPGNPPTALPGWFVMNNWQHIVYYSIAPGYSPGGSNSCEEGCLTVQVAGVQHIDKHAIVVAAGAALSDQTRPSGELSDYLEDLNLAPPEDEYETKPLSFTFNDIVAYLPLPGH